MGRADSETLKARKQANLKAHLLLRAVEAYNAAQLSGKPRTVAELARDFHVSQSTLHRHVSGKRTKGEFTATKQKLTSAEEQTLVEFVLGCADRGLPSTHAQLASFANNILKQRLGANAVEVGKNWSDRFVERHHQVLSTHWTRPLDGKRARALRPEVVEHWFSLVKEFIHDKGIKVENTYGMDESGFPPANAGRQKVIGRRGTKGQHRQGGADKENVTAVVTICADGTALPPTVIFKAKNMQSSWNSTGITGIS